MESPLRKLFADRQFTQLANILGRKHAVTIDPQLLESDCLGQPVNSEEMSKWSDNNWECWFKLRLIGLGLFKPNGHDDASALRHVAPVEMPTFFPTRRRWKNSSSDSDPDARSLPDH